MKMSYYLGVLSFLLCVNEAHSYSPYHSTNLVAQIKPNPTIGSKPTAHLIKLANVSFLPEYDGSGVNFGCGDGYTFINGVCEANACEGYPYSEATLVANCETSEKCKSGAEYKYRCTSCSGNLALSGGKCSCSSESYPYNETDNPCLYAYDETAKCSEVGVDGTKKASYAGCKCPDAWLKCDGSNAKGLGTACDSYGELSYYSCGCEDTYNKTCVDSRPVDSGDYCLNLSDGVRYYDECYSCDLSQGEVYSYDDYWCNHEWIEFPVVGDLLNGGD